LLTTLLDLVLPAACAGCGATGSAAPLCPGCAAAFCAVRPQRVRPDPEPAGLPPTFALAAYDGAVRAALLAYKEKGRHGLSAALGDQLARVVARGAGTIGAGLLLVPVPGTAAAIRQRHGDHVVRLAERAARTLRRQGRPAAVAGPLRALPKSDSVELSARDRARAAETAFALRPGRLPSVRAAEAGGAVVVLVDDIVTTGSTLVAAANRLAEGGVPVHYAAVIAATRRHGTSDVLHRT
jgi:predicted amidophosphoribosyltransferase